MSQTLSTKLGQVQYTSAQVGWGLQVKTIPENDTLRAYWSRIKDRPARLAADAKDNALLPPRPE